MRLAGIAPSGLAFVANPVIAWAIPASRERIRGVDAGEPGPLPEQAHLGDFRIPQRKLFVVGREYFEPLDPSLDRRDTHAVT